MITVTPHILQAFSGITCRSAMSNNFYFLWYFFKNCLFFYSKSSSLFLPRNFSLQQLCNPWQPYEWLPVQTKSQDLTHWIELYLIVVHYSHSFQCHQTTERKSKQISLTNQVRRLYCKLRTKFFTLQFMAQAQSTWAINRRGKNKDPYGPRRQG